MEHVAEIQVSWLDWMVLHAQRAPGQPIPSPSWWPTAAPALPLRLRWHQDGRLLVDGDPFDSEATFHSEGLTVRVRWTLPRRAAPAKQPVDHLWVSSASTTMSAFGALVILLLTMPFPDPVTLIDLPTRCGGYILHTPDRAEPGSHGGEGTPAAGEPGRSGVPEALTDHGGHPVLAPPTWSRHSTISTVGFGHITERDKVDTSQVPHPSADSALTSAAGTGLSDAGSADGADGRDGGHAMFGRNDDFLGKSGVENTLDHAGTPTGPNAPPDRSLLDTVDPAEDPLSSFALVTDPNQYDRVRGLLRAGTLPEPDSVRIEDIVNARRYPLPVPSVRRQLATSVESAPHPWREGHRLLRVSLQAHAPQRVPDIVVHIQNSALRQETRRPLEEALGRLVDSLPASASLSVVGERRTLLSRAPVGDRSAAHEAIARFQWTPGASVDSNDTALSIAYSSPDVDFCLTSGDIRPCRRSDADRPREGWLLAAAASRVEAIEALEAHVRFNPETVSSYRLLGVDPQDQDDAVLRADPREPVPVSEGHQVTALYEYVPTEAAGTIATVELHTAERTWTTDVRTQHRSEPSAVTRTALAAAGLAGMLRGDDWVVGATAAELAALAAGDPELVELIWRAEALLP